jgi:PAS domain S-box-containing protein
VLWDALTQDAEVDVVVVDTHGTIQFANAAVQGALGASGVDLRGKSWHDLLPKDVADERVRCAKQVVETSQPIALIGMIRGVCRCAIFRPIESDAHEGA